MKLYVKDIKYTDQLEIGVSLVVSSVNRDTGEITVTYADGEKFPEWEPNTYTQLRESRTPYASGVDVYFTSAEKLSGKK